MDMLLGFAVGVFVMVISLCLGAWICYFIQGISAAVQVCFSWFKCKKG
ncbi:hypothetical protein [Campylobacter sp. MIT 99-7217]|nr:hypothetical protein [Campylobacter sp. MIT 99-7217]